MEFYQRLLIILLPTIIFIVIFRLIQIKTKNKKDTVIDNNQGTDENQEKTEGIQIKNKRILQFPFYYRLVMFLVFLFCVFISIFLLIFQFEGWPCLIILYVFFGFPALIIFTCWSLWRVEILPDGFIYRNYFGKKREYKFIDLEYRMHPKGLKWYFYKNGKKIFCMPFYIENEIKLKRAYNKFRQKNKKR